MNYLFGVGLMLWAFAAWVTLADRPILLRCAVALVAVTAVYLSHLVAFGLLGTLIGGCECARVWRQWRQVRWRSFGGLAIAAVATLPAVALFLAQPTTRNTATSAAIQYAPEWWFKPFVLARTVLSGHLSTDVRSALSLLPPSSLLFSADAGAPPETIEQWLSHWQPPLIGAAALASLHNRVFVAQTFALPGQQPITVAPHLRWVTQLQGTAPIFIRSPERLERAVRAMRAAAGSAGLAEWPLYLFLINPIGSLPADVQETARGRNFQLLRLN